MGSSRLIERFDKKVNGSAISTWLFRTANSPALELAGKTGKSWHLFMKRVFGEEICLILAT
jgi:hypothetical protein